MKCLQSRPFVRTPRLVDPKNRPAIPDVSHTTAQRISRASCRTDLHHRVSRVGQRARDLRPMHPRRRRQLGGSLRTLHLQTQGQGRQRNDRSAWHIRIKCTDYTLNQ